MMSLEEAKNELESLVAKKDPRFKTCEDFLRFAYSLIGITLPESLYDTSDYTEATRRTFTMVEPPYKLYDIAVFRNFTAEIKRHVGVMLDNRQMVHFLTPIGVVARAEITRDQFRFSLIHVARYKDLT